MMKAKRENIRKLAQQAGSDDRQTLVLQKQFAMEHLASLRKELSEIESQKRKAEAILRTRRPDTLQETAAPLVSNAEVDRLVEEDPGVSGLSSSLADMQHRLAAESSHSKQVARNSAMDPVVKKLREEVSSLKNSLTRRRAEIRRLVIRRLQDPESGIDPSKRDTTGLQLAVFEDVEQHLRAEIEKLSKSDEKQTENTLDLQDLQDDVAQIQQAATKLSSEVEMLNVEIQAPNRIIKIEDAETPTVRDEKKRYVMIGVITLGSFLGTMFGVAFLELQARKVDSTDDVVVDLGLAVVGALPKLPSKARDSGMLQRTEKERYWYNLLLESVDATRTMLVHAARSGNYRVVMITSALPGEGKTSLSSHLATSLARSGLKTLLIDADLRQPLDPSALRADPGAGHQRAPPGRVQPRGRAGKHGRRRAERDHGREQRFQDLARPVARGHGSDLRPAQGEVRLRDRRLVAGAAGDRRPADRPAVRRGAFLDPPRRQPEGQDPRRVPAVHDPGSEGTRRGRDRRPRRRLWQELLSE